MCTCDGVPDAYQRWQTIFPDHNEWCGRAENVPLHKLAIENERLIIRRESVFNGMLVAKWGIDSDCLNDSNPPVVCVLGDRVHHCADRVSQFAVFCSLFDTVNSFFTKDAEPDNDHPFPTDGIAAEFPESFGVIKTEFYEGQNWVALASGSDWYLRTRSGDVDRFVKHEIRSENEK